MRPSLLPAASLLLILVAGTAAPRPPWPGSSGKPVDGDSGAGVFLSRSHYVSAGLTDQESPGAARSDRQAHRRLAGAMLVLVFRMLVDSGCGEAEALAAASAVCAASGLLKEILDGAAIGGSGFDIGDLAADAVGIAAGVGLLCDRER
ncbi:hypothetical protein JW921_07595 [Candidatus Fermentibacterales bacterium]|nr:hypothetical protein [Candidatus Fermentibacterales bacterium]